MESAKTLSGGSIASLSDGYGNHISTAFPILFSNGICDSHHPKPNKRRKERPSLSIGQRIWRIKEECLAEVVSEENRRLSGNHDSFVPCE
ncbi:hypothetical protein AAY473_005460 [Plecturocebus cupreus]